tara:strand:- start:306 stop:482 length:177 start_codon:yes stop_codon:yes gene_type:complete
MEIIKELEQVIGVFLLIIMAFFVYASSHLISERKAGKQLPMFWEKKPKKRGRPPKKKK